MTETLFGFLVLAPIKRDDFGVYANANATDLFLQLLCVRLCLLFATSFGLVFGWWSLWGLTLLLLLRLDLQLFRNPNPARIIKQTSTSDSRSGPS